MNKNIWLTKFFIKYHNNCNNTMIEKKTLFNMAIVFVLITAIGTAPVVYAQDSPDTNVSASSEDNVMVLSLEDTRNGAIYQYTVNSTSQMAELIKSVYKMGSPQGVGTESLENDPTISAIDAIVTEDEAATSSIDEEGADVAGWGWLKKTFNAGKKIFNKGMEIASQYGPIAVKLAALA